MISQLKNKKNLLEYGVIRKLIRQRKYQFSLSFLFLIIFGFTIFAGFYGTTLGNANFATIFVWLVWFTLLLSFLIPILGRLWCSVCPIPIIGDWFQRGRLFTNPLKSEKLNGLKRRMPKQFRNLWISNILFIAFAAMAGILTVNPRLTAIILLLFFIFSTASSLVFRGRSFCRYICPVGGFIGVYSLTAPLELRVKNKEVCRAHKAKDCIFGNEEGYGCPWGEYPGKLDKNINCGLCLECIRTCPEDNIELNLRPFGGDLYSPKKNIDEAFRAIIMVGASLIYLISFFGPFAELKELANWTSFQDYLKYFIFLLFVLIFFFGLIFMLPSYISRFLIQNQEIEFNEVFVNYSYSLIPIGMMTWIGFSLQIIVNNWSSVIRVIFNPFGWGWYFFDYRNHSASVLAINLVLILFVILLFVGYFWTANSLSAIFQSLYHDNDDYQISFVIHLAVITFYLMAILFVLVG